MASVLAQSCQKWLEATSSTQVSDTKMFSSRSGFHEAVTGVYIDMGSSACYGRNYTFFVNELSVLCDAYNSEESNPFHACQQHLYSNGTMTSLLEYMWRGGYNVIANANKILYEVDNRRDVITDETEYNLIKGEMLAVRAYMHFDLMRMFGLSSWTSGNAGKKTIPYVTEYAAQVTPQSTYSEAVELLLADVDAALTCLKSDPVTGNKPGNFDDVTNTDGYWNNRTLHLNYYAVEALAARIYTYVEEYEKARPYLQDIVDNVFEKGVVDWIDPEEEVNKSSNDQNDWTFTSEQLFTLEITDLSSYTAGYCFGSTPKMILDPTFIEDLFYHNTYSENPVLDGAEDIRGYAKTLKYGGTGYTSYKFYYSSSLASSYRNRMPMIRVSEVYYMLFLADYKAGDYESCLKWLETVTSHRGYTNTDLSEYVGYPDSLYEIFERDVIREFLGEGQMFHWVKMLLRMDKDGFVSAGMGALASGADLLYPYPSSETSYGHIQEQ